MRIHVLNCVGLRRFKLAPCAWVYGLGPLLCGRLDAVHTAQPHHQAANITEEAAAAAAAAAQLARGRDGGVQQLPG